MGEEPRLLVSSHGHAHNVREIKIYPSLSIFVLVVSHELKELSPVVVARMANRYVTGRDAYTRVLRR